MVERTTGESTESREKKGHQEKLCDIEGGRARLENLVSRGRADLEPDKGGEKKSFVKLSECDQLIDLAPVIIRDPHSRITLWTSGDQQLYGYSSSEAVGKVSHDLLKTIFPVSKEAVYEALEKDGSWHGELVHTTKDGRQITVTSRWVLYYEGGKVVAILEVNNDVSGLKRSENAMRESETKLARAQRIAHIGSWSWDLSDDKLTGSEEFFRLFVLAPRAYITYGQFLDLLHPADREGVNRAVQAAIHQKQPYSIDYRVIRPDKTERIVHAEGEISGCETGEHECFFGTVQDITERKQADQALAEQTTKLQEQSKVIDLAHVMIRDLQSRIILWTSGDEILYGYKKEEVLGKITHELFKTVFPVSKDAVDEALQKTGRWQGELIHTAKDGHKVTVASHQVLYREHDKPVAILEVNNDITEQKQVFNELYESRELLARSQEMAHLGSWVWYIPENKQIWTDERYRMYGLSPGEITPGYEAYVSFIHPEDRPGVKQALDQALHEGTPFNVDYRSVRRDGAVRYIHAEGNVIFDSNHRPVKMFAFGQDITERKQVEETLRKQAALIDLSPDGIFVRKYDGTITFWSHGAEALYGWAMDEAIGKKANQLLKKDFSRPMDEINKQLLKTGFWSGEVTETTKSGRKITVQSRWMAEFDRDHKIKELMESNVDITERKRVEDELRESESRFRTLADNISQLAWMADASGWIFWYNKRWYDYTGTTPEEMLGWGWQKVHHPDYVEAVTEEWSSRIREGKPYDNVFPLRGKGGQYRWFLTRVVPIRDKDGKIQRWFGTNTDITELKQAEDRLREAKNQAELYLDIMGHDINNLNQVALTNLDLIQGDENLTEDQNETLADALNSVRGSAAIIDNVRKIQAITHEKLPLHPEDLDAIIKGCIAEAPKPAEYTVKINYSPGPGSMVMGTTLLKEVFSNLITNAIKHAGRDVAIDIRIDEVVQAGKMFYDISIADNGPGIPDALKPRLFARFQRGDTKAHGKGLGLFIVKSLVETAGGDVRVADRVPGDYTQGAKFIVSLPAWEGRT